MQFSDISYVQDAMSVSAGPCACACFAFCLLSCLAVLAGHNNACSTRHAPQHSQRAYACFLWM